MGQRIADRILEETNLLRWLHAEALHRAETAEAEVERWKRAWQGADREWAKDRASRQAWAAEAMRLEMELAKFREIALDGNGLYSAMLVGIGGEHDDPPSNEQIERALRLWENHINRELRRPDWHPKLACGRGDACDQHGALFRHSDGTPCWGCQICLESEEDAVEDDGARPGCAVHPLVFEAMCKCPTACCDHYPEGPAGTPWAEGGEPE